MQERDETSNSDARTITPVAAKSHAQRTAEAEIETFRQALGPFVVAAETTRMPMIFTDAKAPDNPIIFANKSFLDLTGYKRVEVMGHTIGLVLAHITDAKALENLTHALACESEDDLELECRRKDGSRFLAAVLLCPVRDASGVVIQNFLSFVELTGQVDRLLAQKNEFTALYQHAPGFIATLKGPDHRYSFVNSAYENLVGRHDLRGLTVREAFPELVPQGFIELLDNVYATGNTYVARGMAITLHRPDKPDPVLHYLDFVYQPIRNDQDKVIGLFCEGNDVTDQRRALQEVFSLQDEIIHLSRVSVMGTMATALAHELNQPLSAISNYSAAGRALLDEGGSHIGALRECLVGIGEGSKRAGEIIRHLREMTVRGQTRHDFFDSQEAVGECVRLIRAGGHDGIEIDDKSIAGPLVEGDRVQIQQVVLNLLRNACEAVTGLDRRIVTISTCVEEDQLVVRVADNGTGVPLESARTLFEWSASSKDDGMGIGLSISRTIIEAHDGRIWLDDSSSAGACFAFSLPIGDPEIEP